MYKILTAFTQVQFGPSASTQCTRATNICPEKKKQYGEWPQHKSRTARLHWYFNFDYFAGSCLTLSEKYYALSSNFTFQFYLWTLHSKVSICPYRVEKLKKSANANAESNESKIVSHCPL